MITVREINSSIFNVEQGFYLVQAISRDFNMSVGMPSAFDCVYNMRKKITNLIDVDDIKLGEAVLIDNVFNLIVKESSYDMPDLTLIRSAIREVSEFCRDYYITRIAMPKICSGRNGLNWDYVLSVVYEEFKNTFENSSEDVEIVICVA